MGVSRIFWDTNLFIYLIEDYGDLSEQVFALRERMLERQDTLVTSALTLGEILVKPTLAGRQDLCGHYAQALRSGARLVAFDEAAAAAYASIRCDKTIRPPDAMQLACAAQAKVDLFVTNDDRLSRKRVRGIEFVTSLARAPL